ncbi:MAG: hypothetical protein MK111_24610 [Crocosphaera sp.]|uniref:YHS domain-containing (seleno)protein n=1 Tax=Crocosphaera sp. TaxID=2729996 RepID=UPI002589C194|nr:YHS domain-containing (seleno)protein [Crocosphaera sp.]MCH2232491.1 hypothetical protein [Crocinitomicaceae bacterium]MCH2247770.1 hypothetical protein [Crocosphaera sp.]
MKHKKIAIFITFGMISAGFIAGAITFFQLKTMNNSPEQDPPLLTQIKTENPQLIFFQEKGVAIKGIDPVAYFLERQAVKGQEEFSYRWENTTWWFKSAENRDLFIQEPTKYAPQYGGFCAWAVSNNYTAPIDPEAWSIVDNKLYLNYNKRIQKRWSKNIESHITKGNYHWPQILESLQKQ